MNESGRRSGIAPRTWTSRSVAIVAAIVLQVIGILVLQSRLTGGHGLGEKIEVVSIQVADGGTSAIAIDVAPQAEPVLETPPVSFSEPLPQIEVEGESGAGKPTPVRINPPRLVEASEGTLREFSRLVRLPEGDSARVVLSVEILADGSVGAVAVESSSGDEAADGVAVKYAKSLRWHPANIRGNPLPIRISMPVVFGTNG